MRKLLPWAFSSILAAGAVGAYLHLSEPQWLHFDLDNGEDDAPDPDQWIVRNTYANGALRRFDPQWVVEAAEQERLNVAAATPAGAKTYAKHLVPNSPLALQPNTFVPLGPMPENNTQQSYGSVSGRVNVIAIDPVDPTIAYFGSDGGGIWKTTNCCSMEAPPNNPTAWQPVTDVPEVAGLSISDITIDANNHNTIYGATGDLNYGSFSFGAVGVLKSTDQGQSWRLLGTDVFSPYYTGSAGGFPQYQAIGKVVVDPNNSNTVIVGTKTSVYFSYDAGENWVGPCYTNQYATGASSQRQDVTGLVPVSNGDGTTRLYVAIGTRGSATPVQPDLGQNGANGVYRLATIPSGGCPATNAWTLLNNGWLPSTGTGAPQTDFGRIELAVSPDQPNTMYAMLQSLQTASKYQVLGVWRSDDAGTTWTQKAATANVARCGTDSSSAGGGSQMWYDARLVVQPGNPETTFLSGYDIYRSTDGGATYADITCGWTTKPAGTLDHVHVDQHALTFLPGSSTKMMTGSDGGVYYVEDANATFPSFRQLNETINSIEFYFGDITSNFANAANPAIGAGAQDNGCSAVKFNGTPTGPVKWNSNCSGDGTTMKIEPVYNAIWFNSSQYGSLARSLTYGNNNPLSGSFSTASGNTGGTWGGAGDLSSTIFAMSYDIYKWGVLDAAGSGCSTASGCNHMIAGTNRLWETTDLANPTASTMRASWKARTANLTKNNLIIGTDNRSYINYVAYSFTDPTVAAVGTNDGNMQIVFGLGGTVGANCPMTPPLDGNCANAVNVTDNNNVLPNRPLFGVRFDARSALVAYAAVGGFNQNTPGRPGHVFQVTCADYGCSSFGWKDKSGNLPNIPVEQIMPNPNLPQQVFAGTDWGLYYTDNIDADSPVWHYFEGFPRAMVWELVVDRGFTTLAAFTRSRGAWVWPLPNAAIGSGADLAVAQTGPASVALGAQASYTVTVNNNGPNTAYNVVLNDPVPVGVTLASVTGACSAFPCNFASLPSTASRTATVTYTVPAGYDVNQPLVNVASSTSDTEDPNPANNSSSASTTVTMAADLALAMQAPTSAVRGGTVTYTIAVSNHGPGTASAVSIDDPAPAGLVFVANSGDCTTAFPCDLGTLANGTVKIITATFSVPYDYAGPSPFTNTATVDSATPDPASANNSASVNVATTDSADVSITQTGTAAVLAGNSVSYTVTVGNAGPSAASGVVVDDPVPAGLVAGSVSGDCAALPCSLGTLNPGDSRSFVVTFGVPPDYAGANPVANIASVSSGTTDPNMGNNVFSAYTTVGAGADITIAIAAPDSFLRGGSIVYQVSITNNGPSAAEDAQLNASLPAGLNFVSNSGDCTSAWPCAIGHLDAGATRTVTTTVCVASNYSGNLLRLDANGGSGTSDPYMGNNSASAYVQFDADSIFRGDFESDTCH